MPKISPKTLPVSQDTFVKQVNAVKDINSTDFISLAKTLHKGAQEDFGDYLKLFSLIFSDKNTKVQGRIKDISSIVPKLKKYADKIGFKPLDEIVPDLYGYRIVTDGSIKSIKKVVSKIEELIDNHVFYPGGIYNHGKYPYFTPEDIEKLQQKGFFISSKTKSAFSGVNMYFITNSNKLLELQIVGDKVNIINTKEHLFYNFKTKNGATEAGVVNEKLQKLFEDMTPEDIEKYDNYIEDCYMFARNCELKNKIKKPKLPEGLDLSLALI